jgi:hypothetical protein
MTVFSIQKKVCYTLKSHPILAVAIETFLTFYPSGVLFTKLTCGFDVSFRNFSYVKHTILQYKIILFTNKSQARNAMIDIKLKN